jgi:hypothetical protein
MYSAGSKYMFPRRGGVLLGGTHEIGVWTTEPDESVIAGTLEGHKRISEGVNYSI